MNATDPIIINELNTQFAQTLIHYRFFRRQPLLIDCGKYPAEQAIVQAASIIEQRLETDETHAILAEPFDFSTDPITFRYRSTPYSHLAALRQHNRKPPQLSANIIAVDPNSRTIVLHHRSTMSHVYPDTISIPGGGFQPATDNAGGDADLAATALREFHEETGLTATLHAHTAILATQETSTGSVQINFLGAVTQTGTSRNTWEGVVQLISFDALYTTLVNERWAPVGKSCLLAWLALGAPGLQATSNMSNCAATAHGMDAQALFGKYCRENR